ncbi:glucokinase regulatory-like protein [Alkaliphilus metalliredigens QYMF]|uniref:N-acetylmuramic acid 6-phosphate etherase n=1 Tax=Alkaliphilus metalliredigens (strain QYMF) TaxID=293826 RepID=MURQ_ALKMQ|nr:N-acetylmuramic acid 6-phosphate etherase [Alkaliphilus metalliredigens]A6TVQ2.1 RecName: Full=N-acetylmuramic acid 6-phosphate etherase; Short=MurNAc-6-P etherase; AltName: Full=N-acetylmuramic acid 6-phosphate hydrolase; AltName: Full=N-acetylmuramic acid 6-phosphate lyase [Alkaliphilus metalliredigens QYMF]ABR50270.1 glucokinase regulatory-like protein [Alkaliphilus metalliredigens QYMF]
MLNNLEQLTTEKVNLETLNIDEKSPLEIVKVINEEDKKVALAVEKELPNIAKAVEKIIEAFKTNGRLIYLGAGTSGRLGILDAAECPPTFGTSKEQVIGLIAGGREALLEAVEGAEDSKEEGIKDLKNIKLTSQDIVVGIAASGRTPYVVGGLNYANNIGATTVALCCNKDAVITRVADIAIVPVVGPEVIAGSTRLKSGTAQKLVLNMLTTASMIGVGKVYKNLMVDVQTTNEKLEDRSKRIVMMATGVGEIEATEILKNSNYQPKVAILMINTGCSFVEATAKLQEAGGFVKKALEYIKEGEEIC